MAQVACRLFCLCQSTVTAVVKAGIWEQASRKSIALQRRHCMLPSLPRFPPGSTRGHPSHGAAKSSLACADQDLPAGSACSLLLNPGKTANHTKSDTETHTYTHAGVNTYHLCTKRKQNNLLLYVFQHFCFGYYPTKHLCWKTSQPFFPFITEDTDLSLPKFTNTYVRFTLPPPKDPAI